MILDGRFRSANKDQSLRLSKSDVVELRKKYEQLRTMFYIMMLKHSKRKLYKQLKEENSEFREFIEKIFSKKEVSSLNN